MDTDDQKKQTKTITFLSGCQLNGCHVLPAAGVRCLVQDALRLHWELLGHRYHILLAVRGVLAVLLLAVQIFKT